MASTKAEIIHLRLNKRIFADPPRGSRQLRGPGFRTGHEGSSMTALGAWVRAGPGLVLVHGGAVSAQNKAPRCSCTGISSVLGRENRLAGCQVLMVMCLVPRSACAHSSEPPCPKYPDMPPRGSTDGRCASHEDKHRAHHVRAALLGIEGQDARYPKFTLPRGHAREQTGVSDLEAHFAAPTSGDSSWRAWPDKDTLTCSQRHLP